MLEKGNALLKEDDLLLKEQCLYPKLENIAIQILNFENLINPL